MWFLSSIKTSYAVSKIAIVPLEHHERLHVHSLFRCITVGKEKDGKSACTGAGDSALDKVYPDSFRLIVKMN